MRALLLAVATLVLVTSCGGTPGPSVLSAPSASTVPSAQSSASTGELRIPKVAGPPEALDPGTYLSPEGFEPPLTVAVPDGWYGGGGPSEFGVGLGFDEVEQRFEKAGFYVNVIPTRYDEAVTAFQQLDGLTIESGPDVGEFAGWDATTFASHAAGEHVVLDEIAPGLDIGDSSIKQILVDADGSTLLVRTEVFDDAAKADIDEVLDSLTRG